jgi:hypothetical protein
MSTHVCKGIRGKAAAKLCNLALILAAYQHLADLSADYSTPHLCNLVPEPGSKVVILLPCSNAISECTCQQKLKWFFWAIEPSHGLGATHFDCTIASVIPSTTTSC